MVDLYSPKEDKRILEIEITPQKEQLAKTLALKTYRTINYQNSSAIKDTNSLTVPAQKTVYDK